MNYSSSTPDDAVWIDDEELDDIESSSDSTQDVDFDEDVVITSAGEAAEAFAHETAAEAASVFIEKGETAAEAATSFEPTISQKVADLAAPAIASVVSKVAPVVAQVAVAVAPKIAHVEEVAKPYIDKAQEKLSPTLKKAEPLLEKATATLNDVIDVVAHKADDAAEVIDQGTERLKDTVAGFTEAAKPVAVQVIQQLKSQVNKLTKRDNE
jgi:gas vesicle protein